MEINQIIKINVNETVYLELTDEGRAIIESEDCEYLLSKNDSSIELSFWLFLNIFGKYFPKSPGFNKIYFKNNEIHFKGK